MNDQLTSHCPDAIMGSHSIGKEDKMKKLIAMALLALTIAAPASAEVTSAKMEYTIAARIYLGQTYWIECYPEYTNESAVCNGKRTTKGVRESVSLYIVRVYNVHKQFMGHKVTVRPIDPEFWINNPVPSRYGSY